MTQAPSMMEATLLFGQKPAVDYEELVNVLDRTFRKLSLDLDIPEVAHDCFIAYSGADICASVAANGEDLVVRVTDGIGRRQSDFETRVDALYNMVLQIIEAYPAETVQWGPSDTSYGAAEFGDQLNADMEGTLTRVKLRLPKGLTRKAIFIEAEKINIFEDIDLEEAARESLDENLFDRLGELESAREEAEEWARSLPGGHHPIPAHEASVPGTDAVMKAVQSALYPGGRPFEQPKRVLSFSTANNPFETPEANDVAAKLTVYAMNATLLVAAFPVGAAVLMYNALGGENLRTTAHALALTGGFIGLSMTDRIQTIMAWI